MSMVQLKKNILAASKTAEQAQQLVEAWHSLVEQLLFRPVSGRTAHERYQAAVAEWPDERVRDGMQMWGTDWLQLVSAENFHEYATELRGWVNRVPIFVVYVPVELPEQGVAIIHDWVRTEVNAECLLELRVSANVVGGCAFIAKDHYHDYSLHGRLQRDTDVVPNILRSYEKSK